MRAEVRESHAASKRRYGYRMVQRDMRRRDVRVSPKRTLKLMQIEGIRGKRGPRWKRPNVALATVKPQDLIKHNFHVSEPGKVIFRDIKYIPTKAGWVYADFLKDGASRRILAWSADTQRTKEVTTRTTKRFLASAPHGFLVHHSDAGGEYVNDDLQQLLSDHEIQQSCGRGSGANNMIESFNSTLEVELIRDQSFKNVRSVRRALAEYIPWYNGFRLHSALGYRTPDEAAADYHPDDG